jgi:hypothetical protein
VTDFSAKMVRLIGSPQLRSSTLWVYMHGYVRGIIKFCVAQIHSYVSKMARLQAISISHLAELSTALPYFFIAFKASWADNQQIWQVTLATVSSLLQTLFKEMQKSSHETDEPTQSVTDTAAN